jgi:hypothetical protein
MLAALAALANAETVVVKRQAVLRSQPSSSGQRITSLSPGETLDLVSLAVRNGFRHVITKDGQKGWVWSNNVQVQDEGDSSEGATSGSTGTTTSSDLVSKLLAMHSDAVGQPLIENGSTVCGPTGDTTDPHKKTLNTNKNRTDIPTDNVYVPIDWASLRDLPSDHAEDLPGSPLTVQGFLVHRVKQESDGSGESTNCHLLNPDEVDWHIYLSDTAGLDDISQAVIVETTPRTRPLHKWKKSDLDAVVNKNVPVRISGWLLYDFEHVNAIGTQRATVWEVHPITKIEIQRNGQWVDLDQ